MMLASSFTGLVLGCGCSHLSGRTLQTPRPASITRPATPAQIECAHKKGGARAAPHCLLPPLAVYETHAHFASSHTKPSCWCVAGGSTKNGRDSNAQRRGVKVYGGQRVKAGGIIVRQLGTVVRHASSFVLAVFCILSPVVASSC